MPSFFSPQSLARASARRPWLTVAAWAVVIVAAIAGASLLSFDESQSTSGTDSGEAKQLLEDRLHGPAPVTETIIVQSGTQTVDDPAFKGLVASLVSSLHGMTGTVKAVTSYYESGDTSLVSPDRHKTLIPVVLTGEQKDAAETVGPVLALLKAKEGGEFSLLTAGTGSINRAVNETVESDLQLAEAIGLPVALVVLIIVFGAAAAAGVPVVLSLLGIVVAVGITGVLSRVFGLGSIVINMITMIGLAVGIDYTLFIVERFREERHAGREKVAAIVAAGNTSSRAVLFSGITVIIALAGLLIVPSSEFKGLAIGAITVVFSSVLVALTLLPATLSLLGDRINWLTLPGRGSRKTADSGFFAKTTAIVVRHPLVAAVSAVMLLVAAATPYLAIKLGSPGISDLPQQLEPVRAFKVLDEDFSAGRIAPTDIVIEGDVHSAAVTRAVAALEAKIAADPDFSQLSTLETNQAGDLGAMTVQLKGDALASDARAAVERLRGQYVPGAFVGVEAKVLVGGQTAMVVDYVDTMNRYLPIVIAFVLTLSFVLLTMVFRSLVIPVKAIVMNLLSVGAAYGLMVLVFQEGVGADLFGFHQGDSIAAFIPIFMFGVLFGLSMDYHVFLLSRIQERFVHTGDNTEAVSYGLRSTAHIITGAAAIMMVVFSGFAMGDMVELQQTGFGLAVAVFIDATIVRSVLVPASMEMLGDWNWYLPRWLGWLPRISVEGHVQAERLRGGFESQMTIVAAGAE